MRKWIGLAVALVLAGGVFAAEHGYHHATSLPGNFKCDGAVAKRTFHSAALDRDRVYYVYMPPGYDNAGNTARYPVLYMLHGCPGNPVDWISQGKVISAYEDLLRKKKVRPMMMVFPDGEGPRFEFDCTGFLNKSDGTFSMEDAMVKDQVADMDGHFRTVADADHRALAGLSSGGYAAVNLGVRHPDVFRVMVSHSGYFNVGDFPPIPKRMLGPDNKSAWAANSPAAVIADRGVRKDQHFYVDIGDDDNLLPGNRAFAALLKRDGADLEYREFHGAHTWAGWRAQLPYSLAFVSSRFGR